MSLIVGFGLGLDLMVLIEPMPPTNLDKLGPFGENGGAFLRVLIM